MFGVALLWFTFAIIIEFSRKGRVIKKCYEKRNKTL